MAITEDNTRDNLQDALSQAGLPRDAVASWYGSDGVVSGDYRRDAEDFSRQWRIGTEMLAFLPAKPSRSAAQAAAASTILERDRTARRKFLNVHAPTIYRAITGDLTKFKRIEQLVGDAAVHLPGLVPDERTLSGEGSKPQQREKDGAEIDQGLFLSHVLADPACGMHLCHAMLLPHPATAEASRRFAKDGRLDLEGATLERHGKAAIVTMRNPRFLNAEDEATVDGLEATIDVATLDRETDIAVLRGDTVEHSKYRGRRLFSAGINLTHLYYGKISYVWYIKRDMGLVNKLFRGVARPDMSPDELAGGTTEKPWVGVVDGFAIGGGCQLLLVLDYVLAAQDAYMTLPARKEGIIPGAANLRLWRFTGDRIARQAILYGRRLDCDTPEGRMICDEIAPTASIDAALDIVIDNFTSSGVVSAAGNRRALRVSQEPLDLFRRYMAVYAREQAYCHFSPALIANLERHWNAQNRKA
ncbi:MAG TPA: enoyl-CoA hydratase/isomerase family protein [Xanthobacteraceae bacterium]|jgi:thioesterase DpgC|nr:enoyl-CoA hydratase/isomerase family protein [Xanthobacteraceae bacterium]